MSQLLHSSVVSRAESASARLTGWGAQVNGSTTRSGNWPQRPAGTLEPFGAADE